MIYFNSLTVKGNKNLGLDDFKRMHVMCTSHPLHLDAGPPRPGPLDSLVPSKFSLTPRRRQKHPK